MQDVFVQDGSKWHVGSSKVGRVHERVIEWGGNNELNGSEERSKVAVKVVFLLACLAIWRRPQLNRVDGDAHVVQARGGGHN